MALFDKVIKRKSSTYSVKHILNEMAKKIDHRTLDRKLWLSVASVCSRNKATECELVRPMKKLTKDDLINRYVAALIIMKKPCPKSERDIDKIKVFKLFGHRILELGGTIEEIQQLYNINMGITSKPVVSRNPIQKQELPTTPIIHKPRAKRSVINKKYIAILDSLIQNIPTSLYDSTDFKSSFVGSYNKAYNKCESDIELYVNTLVKKSGQNFDKLISLIQNDMINFNKLFKNTDDILFKVYNNVGTRRRGYDTFYQWLTINIKEDSYDCFIHNETASFAPDARRRDFNEKFDGNNLFKYNFTACRYFNDKPNMIKVFSQSVFLYIVKPYINYKLNGEQALNASNSEETLIKYKMSNYPTNYFKWVKENIKDILHNNPDKLIKVNYNDWSGAIKSLYYNTDVKKYMVQCYLQSDSSDMDKSDILENLIRLSPDDTYRCTYSEDNSYSDSSMYTCVVKDLNAFGEKLFNVIKEDIINGKLI